MDEQMYELVRAIYAGDLGKAKEVLVAISRDRRYYAEAIARGKAHGERIAANRVAQADAVPLPKSNIVLGHARDIRAKVEDFVDVHVDDHGNIAAEDAETLVAAILNHADGIIAAAESATRKVAA